VHVKLNIQPTPVCSLSTKLFGTTVIQLRTQHNSFELRLGCRIRMTTKGLACVSY